MREAQTNGRRRQALGRGQKQHECSRAPWEAFWKLLLWFWIMWIQKIQVSTYSMQIKFLSLFLPLSLSEVNIAHHPHHMTCRWQKNKNRTWWWQGLWPPMASLWALSPCSSSYVPRQQGANRVDEDMSVPPAFSMGTLRGTSSWTNKEFYSWGLTCTALHPFLRTGGILLSKNQE